MNLKNVKKNAQLIITSINYEDIYEEAKLNNLGVIIGETIKLVDINSFKKAYFIKIGENQFYINEPLAERIEVNNV